MPTPAQLREASRLYCQTAENEATPEIRRRLVCHALALSQLAEVIERRERVDEFVRDANITRYRRMMAGPLDEKQRKMIEPLLKGEQAKLRSRSATKQHPGNHSRKCQEGGVS
jgi:hypothetical protein